MINSILYSGRRAVKLIASYDTYRNFPLKIENEDIEFESEIIFISKKDFKKIENDHRDYISFHKKDIMSEAIMRIHKAHGVKIKQPTLDNITIDNSEYRCIYCTVCTKKSKDKDIINTLLKANFIDYKGTIDFPFKLLLID